MASPRRAGKHDCQSSFPATGAPDCHASSNPYSVGKAEEFMPGAVAEITVKEGQQAEFEKLAMEMEQAVNANEPGILYYRLFKVQGESNKYIFMEQYMDVAAVEAHRAAEHFRRIGRAMGAHMDGPPKVTRMDKVK
jgi:quinol monooxygenase YgiN